MTKNFFNVSERLVEFMPTHAAACAAAQPAPAAALSLDNFAGLVAIMSQKRS
jgi:hypothetical protein